MSPTLHVLSLMPSLLHRWMKQQHHSKRPTWRGMQGSLQPTASEELNPANQRELGSVPLPGWADHDYRPAGTFTACDGETPEAEDPVKPCPDSDANTEVTFGVFIRPLSFGYFVTQQDGRSNWHLPRLSFCSSSQKLLVTSPNQPDPLPNSSSTFRLFRHWRGMWRTPCKADTGLQGGGTYCFH